MAAVERQDRWAYGLVVLDIAALLLWTRLWMTDSALIDGDLVFFLLTPAIFLLLGSLGVGMVLRMPSSIDEVRLSSVILFFSTLLVLVPLAMYAWLALMFVTFPEF